MKKGNKILIAVLTALMVLAMGSMAQAKTSKPVAPKKVYMDIFGQYVGGAAQHDPAQGEIIIKNLAKNAKVKLLSGDVELAKYYNSRTKKLWVGVSQKLNDDFLYEDVPVGTTREITFQVKQNKKTYTLSTTLVWRYYPYPIKSIKIGGKKIANSYKKTGEFPVYELGSKKHPVIKYSVKKGIRKGGVYILRGNKYVKYTSKVKLRKGDIICLEFMEKSWAKYDCLYIPVV